MSKTIIVISSLVDSTLKEYQPDINFILFRSIEELDKHITTTPVRADNLFFTRDTIPQVNTSLNYLSQMLENPFLKTDKVTYVTEKGSKELASIKYIIASRSYTNWEIVEGYLTREYVSSIINGTLRTDNISVKRKAVYRVPKDAYVRDKIKENRNLTGEYIEDEQELANIPDEAEPIEILPERVSSCELIHIVGDDNTERSVFAFLAAQYMSFAGKTVIVEKDTEYHRLTEYITKSGVECYFVDMMDVLENPTRALDNIKRTPSKLVCIGSIRRIDYSYSFMVSVLYNNLTEYARYFIREDDFNEAPSCEVYTVVMPATVVGVLKACEELETLYIDNANFVGVNLQSLPQIAISSSTQIETIIKDVLNVSSAPSSIVNIKSLTIGGDSGYDLRSVLRRRNNEFSTKH